MRIARPGDRANMAAGGEWGNGGQKERWLRPAREDSACTSSAALKVDAHAPDPHAQRSFTPANLKRKYIYNSVFHALNLMAHNPALLDARSSHIC